MTAPTRSFPSAGSYSWLAAGLAFLLAAPLFASDLGVDIHFEGASAARETGAINPRFQAGDSAFETFPSDALREPFDTVLLRGSCSVPIQTDAVGREGEFEISRKLPGGDWSPWIKPDGLHLEERTGGFWLRFSFPDAAAGYLRLRARSPSSCVPNLRGAEAFIRGQRESAVQEFPQPLTPAQPAFPPELHVVTREAWGAAAYRNSPVFQYHPRWITQHHTAETCPKDFQSSVEEMRFLQSYHQNGRGWNDIGYHFVIDCLGDVFEARPLVFRGAHVQGHNTDNIGVALMGYYEPPFDDRANARQLEALSALGSWLIAQYGISPDDYRGHRDYNPGTHCPGDNVYAMLPRIRKSFRVQEPASASVAWRDNAPGAARAEHDLARGARAAPDFAILRALSVSFPTAGY